MLIYFTVILKIQVATVGILTLGFLSPQPHIRKASSFISILIQPLDIFSRCEVFAHS